MNRMLTIMLFLGIAGLFASDGEDKRAPPNSRASTTEPKPVYSNVQVTCARVHDAGGDYTYVGYPLPSILQDSRLDEKWAIFGVTSKTGHGTTLLVRYLGPENLPVGAIAEPTSNDHMLVDIYLFCVHYKSEKEDEMYQQAIIYTGEETLIKRIGNTFIIMHPNDKRPDKIDLKKYGGMLP